MNNALKDLIEQAWNNRELLKDNAVQKAIRNVVDVNAAPSNTTTRCP